MSTVSVTIGWTYSGIPQSHNVEASLSITQWFAIREEIERLQDKLIRTLDDTTESQRSEQD